MPIFGENQVRQMYVLDSTHSATLTKFADRAYFNYNGPNGKGGVAPITTDKIQKGHIEDIRITKPAAPALKQWLIATSGAPTSDKDYVVYLHLKNWVGFGENDRYEKFAVVHATSGMTQAQFYTALRTNLEKQFSTEAYKPFEFVLPMSGTVTNKFTAISPVYKTLVIAYGGAADAVTTSGTTITVTFSAASGKTVGDLQTALASYDIAIKPAGTGTTSTTVTAGSTSLSTDDGVAIREKADPITKNDIVMGRFRLPIDMTVTTNEIVAGTTWATSANTDGVIEGTDYKTVLNGGIVAAMEYFFLRGRADRYGLNGGAMYANPSEFVADPTLDYYVLDIKYSYTDSGVHSYKSNKEMTFACTDKTTLETLITNLVSSTTGTTLSGGRDCEIYAVAF